MKKQLQWTLTTENCKRPPTTRNNYLQQEGEQQPTPKDWKLLQMCSKKPKISQN